MDKKPRPLSQQVSNHLRRQATKGTAPEQILLMVLRKKGYLLESNDSGLPGSPDLVLVRHKVAVFVHGCFWHGCSQHFRCPKNNRSWWKSKIEANQRRDVRKARALRRSGYSVITVWEHEDPQKSVRRIQAAVKKRSEH